MTTRFGPTALRLLLGAIIIISLFASQLPASAQNNRADQERGPFLQGRGFGSNGNPKLDSRLSMLLSSENNSAQRAFSVTQSGITLAGDKVRVVVDSLPGQKQSVVDLARGFGTVEATYGNLVQAILPVTALTALADSPAVSFVRLPYEAVPDVVTSEGVSLSGADAWQSDNYTGAGVKIAVLDGGFAGWQTLQQEGELPANAITHWSASLSGPGTSDHGSACAEIVYDMAPGAQLYLVNFSTGVEFGDAVDWLISQGVNMISSSMGWPAVGPGDGTGPIDDIVAKAYAAGILWSQSAGNNAQRYWRGTFTDSNSNGWNDFNVLPLDEGQTISAVSGQTITAYLTWNDPWGDSTDDYDLALFDNANNMVDASTSNQTGTGSVPYEAISYDATYTGTYWIGIYKQPGAAAKQLQLFSGNNDLQYQVASGSLVVPADSPDAMTVGAVFWNSPTTLEPFSSQGPTTDGRIKPDLVAPDGVSTVTYGASNGQPISSGGTGFSGTSAAAPAACGAAALVKQLFPDDTPAQVQAFLEGRAIDLGTIDRDNLYGSGRLCVPPPNLINPPHFVTKWGSGGSEDSEFNQPQDLAVDNSGNVYVADSWNNRVQKFSGAGEFIAKWGTSGNADGQFYWPEGIAVDAAGNVYVADTYNNRVQEFTNSGTFIRKWGSPGGADGQFNQPEGIAVDAAGNVYVADTYNNRVEKFTNSGSFIADIGSAGYGEGQFYFPKGIAIGPSGNVWVADSGGSSVEEFTAAGEFVTKWWGKTIGGGQFTSPNGVGLDQSGHVYVVDTFNNRVQMFTTAGGLITEWGTNGNGDGEFIRPGGTDIDSSGNIYVADSYANDRIEVFSFSPSLSISAEPVTNVDFDSAQLNGSLDCLGDEASANVSFEWGSTSAYGNVTAPQTMTAPGLFSANISGLAPQSTYHFRAKAVSDNGTSYGADETFTTLSGAPTVATEPSGATTAVVIFNGNLTSLGLATSANVSFEWGTSPGNYPNETSIHTTNAEGPFTANITDVTPFATYYFRAKAVGAGIGYGQERSVVFYGVPPTVTTDNATNIDYFSARLNCTIADLGSATSTNVSFAWGLVGTGMPNVTSIQTANETGPLHFDLDGLSANSTYSYVGFPVGYPSFVPGTAKTFTTLTATPPSVTTLGTTGVTYNSATLSANLTSLGTAPSVAASFEWGTAEGNLNQNTAAQSKDSVGTFSASISSLSGGTTYYFRPVADGGPHGATLGNVQSFTTSAAPAPTGGLGGGGGIGGGGGGGGAPVGPGVTNLTIYTNAYGFFNLAAQCKSQDGEVDLSFAHGVTAKAKDGTPLKSLKIVPMDNPPSAPDGSDLIGLAYEITPTGATFSPAISITILYDPGALPENTDLSSLQVAVLNTTDSTWEPLESRTNRTVSSVTATISHFSDYALIGKIVVPPPPPPPPAPANFMVSGVSVNPAKTDPGQTVIVSVNASNTGGTSGDYQLTLKIDDAVAATQTVSIAPGGMSPVTFAVSRSVPGIYRVDVNGSLASFTVSEPQPSFTPVPMATSASPTSPPGKSGIGSGSLIAIVAGAALVLGIIVVALLLRRRK